MTSSAARDHTLVRVKHLQASKPWKLQRWHQGTTQLSQLRETRHEDLLFLQSNSAPMPRPSQIPLQPGTGHFVLR